MPALLSNPPQERKNVEGPLFLVKRRSQPRFQLIVLNKLGTGEGAACSACHPHAAS